MPLGGLLAAAACDELGSLAQLGDERVHALAPRPERLGVAIHVRGQDRHRRLSLPLAASRRVRHTGAKKAEEREER